MVRCVVTVPYGDFPSPVGMKLRAMKCLTLFGRVPKIATSGTFQRGQAAMPRSVAPRVSITQTTIPAPNRDAGSNPVTLGKVDNLVAIGAYFWVSQVLLLLSRWGRLKY